ncbi:hypothetical protein [Poriferisphaera sp. WC338]|uniref:hypothetical protein n=1 Tax=Poriferisphaera sp. WC338 TaxID=3425129 RepID=UPI003D8164CF
MTDKHKSEQHEYDDLDDTLSSASMNIEDAAAMKEAEQQDPELQHILDEAMHDDEDMGYLADMIITRTLPGFEAKRPRPFYRINPGTIRRVAAFAAVIGFSALAFVVYQSTDWQGIRVPPPGVAQGPTIEQIDERLASIPALSSETSFDVADVDDYSFDQRMGSELELLALQMDMVDIQAGLPTEEEAMDMAVTEYEIQQLVLQNQMYF